MADLPPPLGLILVGLLALIATPVARVAFTLAAFAFARDRTYTVITLNRARHPALWHRNFLALARRDWNPWRPSTPRGSAETPIPSISTSTTSPGASFRVLPGVPV